MIMKDFLNDRLQTSLLQRIRYAMKPDEAYGLIFSWENVLVSFCFVAYIIYTHEGNTKNLSIKSIFKWIEIICYHHEL